MAISSAERVRRKREKARKLGLCIACLKERPESRRTTCLACSAAAAKRVNRMRERRREQRRLDKVARGYEAAGDIAMQRFAYIEATAQFERALTESRTDDDLVRLYEKIGNSLFYGARPDFATPWFERALECCTATESLRPKVPAMMRLLPGQRWLESRTTEACETSIRAHAIAMAVGDETGAQYSVASIANILIQLGRYNEAESYLAKLPPDHRDEESSPVRANRFVCRAMILATQGKAATALAEFERAIAAAKEIPDGHATTAIWDDYANWATVLGRLDVARSCRERALLVARERRIAWRIPYLTLRFASTLIIAGEYDQARDLVRDALTYDTATPAIRVLLSIVGVEIAITLHDDDLLKRMFDQEVLELAMQSGEPERIAPIVAAYAKVWLARGERRRAKTLIARGISTIDHAEQTCDLLVLATRYGSRNDAAHAYEILSQRMRLPHHRVVEAYLALCEAYAAQRRRSPDQMQASAKRAARLFGRLGRKHQQAEARTLLGEPIGARKPENRKPILSHLDPTLTARERQVAELVLRGLTNRAIAETLVISEHTVETHMTSILNRLGLRSRWQLMDSGMQVRQNPAMLQR